MHMDVELSLEGDDVSMCDVYDAGKRRKTGGFINGDGYVLAVAEVGDIQPRNGQ